MQREKSLVHVRWIHANGTTPGAFTGPEFDGLMLWKGNDDGVGSLFDPSTAQINRFAFGVLARLEPEFELFDGCIFHFREISFQCSGSIFSSIVADII